MARSPFLPTSVEEMRALGWEAPDVVFVTGDAYVDHPSFAMAVLGRVLESHGFKVAILAQPDWKSADAWRDLGRPRLFYAVSAGNMDSMINHYTANRKKRNDDAYSPGGTIGLRPDRPTPVYAQRCREAFPGVPVVIGGIEASLRRIAHYDYWSDKVRPSILATSKADLLAFGKGEHTITQIAQRLDQGESIGALRDMRGVCYLLGKKEEPRDDRFEHDANNRAPVVLPSFEEIADDKHAFATMTRKFHEDTSPFNARRITQQHGDRQLVQNPPCLPISENEMDAIYDLPYTRAPHFRYTERIPAHAMIKDSVQIMGGCFGGCTFCSITMHEGRIIQSGSKRSIIDEVERIAAEDGFKGSISDLGGPTANMYSMRCTKPEVEAVCRRPSCIHPTVCILLGTDHKPTIGLMRAARSVKGVKKVHIASGIRMDLANLDDEYIDELVGHHVGGHLKVAPEHVSGVVLDHMKKPSHESFETFAEKFADASERAGKEQYLVPYFIASHPGSGPDEMIELAVFLKQRGYRPRQVQDFIPAPMDVATCIFHTGLDPVTMKPVTIVRRMRDRKTQRALMQFFKPENWFEVHAALVAAGRRDLIGSGPLALIPAKPPREALESRKKGDSKLGRAAYVHSEDAGTAPTVGYRPGRKGTRRRDQRS